MPLTPGLSARAELVVSEADSAASLGSGDVAVLGTPRLVALCEEAAFAAVQSRLPEGETSVGNGVQFNHVSPTAVGAKVVAEATLERIEGRRLSFTVSAHDPAGLVGAGRVSRVVVDRDRFLAKIRPDSTTAGTPPKGR